MTSHFIQTRAAEIWLFQPPAVLQALALPESGSLTGESLFGNSNPLEVEIGCGKGKFLLERAEQYPGINFLGIDRISKWMKTGHRRCVKRELRNLKFLKAHAAAVVQRLPAGTVSMFHVYFPDPWPKRRHRRRRLVNQEFLGLLRGRLIPGGRIEIATDDGDYFGEIGRSAAEILWSLSREGNERFVGPGKTNYENKYGAAGKALYYLELQK